MGMITCYRKLTGAELEDLKNHPEKVAGFLYDDDDDSNNLDLDKSWHAIHFLLNNAVWEILPGVGSIILGGIPVSEEDLGYGPARYFAADEVHAINRALQNVAVADLFKNYANMLSHGQEIYPGFEDTADDKEYIKSYFGSLKEYWNTAANENKCLIAYIS